MPKDSSFLAPGSTLMFASHNKGKINEVSAVLSPLGINLLTPVDLGLTAADETASTFIENALIKAREVAQHTDVPVLADDSGLQVFALAGAPGVRSARYAGEPASCERNIQKLLSTLALLPANTDRSAIFYSAMVLLRGPLDPCPVCFEGRWLGAISHEAEGAAGFGYDPVFYDPVLGKTAALMTLEEKNRVSHRGQTLRQLKAFCSAQTALE
jgi:XTP/dITP diphosphohydrolase